MNVRLEVSHNKANVKRVVLRSDTLIGRGPECNLRIASNEVSRRHCMVILTDDGVLVRDLGSSNGTFIDGVQLDPDTDVAAAPGCQLSVGGIKFIVHFDAPVLSAADFEPDAGGSTVDDPEGTVFNNPDETVLDAVPAAPDGWNTGPSSAIAAEPPTELLEGLGGVPPPQAGEDEQTVIEFLPDDPPPPPPAEPGPGADGPDGRGLHDFLRQFEP
ncbi:MAG TPA: FHA domain-containing protein [Planctomycetaceae bacterium]|nr:FHA domain-containing protein [Planctomycetaceae bacterium]